VARQEPAVRGGQPEEIVEGSIGGLARRSPLRTSRGRGSRLDPLHATILGVAVGAFAQVGDLAESLLKRMSGAKDASSVIPGHGGVLDRFDSLYFTAPLLYYYLKMAIFHAY
jgi:phosphatidate cytidylyltransferase